MQPCYISLALWVYLMNIWNQEDEPDQILNHSPYSSGSKFFFNVVVMKFKLYEI